MWHHRKGMMIRTRFVCGLALFLLLITPTLSSAQGFRIGPQGGAAAGQGLAFSAQADDASAVYYNPAGLTQLRRPQLVTGFSLAGGSVSFSGPSGTARGDLGGSISFPPPSNFYLAGTLAGLGPTWLDSIAVGIGVSTPFGLRIRYAENGPFSSVVTRAGLPLIDIKPTVAYRVTNSLSIGAGADIYTFSSLLGEGHVEQHFNLPGGIPAELSASGTKAGFNVSILYTALRQDEGKPILNIGVIYRSGVAIPLRGRFLIGGSKISDGSSILALPPILTVAIAGWPIRRADFEWKLELDGDYVGWGRFDNLDARLDNGVTLPSPAKWRDTYAMMFGSEQKWIKLQSLPFWDFALRQGYDFARTAVPAFTFNPTVPDANQHAVSVGIGLTCHPGGRFLGLVPCELMSPTSREGALGIDLAYAAVFYEGRDIAGNINAVVNGNYRTTLHFGTVGVRVTF